MTKLFELALSISEQIKNKSRVNYEAPFRYLESIEKLEFPKDRSLYQLQNSLQDALSVILTAFRSINIAIKHEEAIGEEELITVLSSKFYNSYRLLRCLIDVDTKWLEENAYKNFMKKEINTWRKSIETFPERAEHYSDLTHLASIYQDIPIRDELLNVTADNFLGYGYHKDIYLDGVLDGIVACHLAGSNKTNNWVKRIAPIIENVTDYTDGDETSHFPKELASILVTVDPDLLYRYYYFEADKESFFLAEDIFRYVIKALRYDSNSQISLATTAIDNSSFAELTERAREDDNAKIALQEIISVIGQINNDKEKEETHTQLSEDTFSSIDYSGIPFNKLEKRLAEYPLSWDRNKFLNNWMNHWANVKDVDKQELFLLLKGIIENEGLANVDSYFLDEVYPLAFNFDSDFAFELLCWAQANGSGWNKYFETSKPQRRWDFLKEKFPHRFMEFFEKSIRRTGKRYGSGNSYFVPIPRGIEFLILFNKVELAEEIMGASVIFAEQLMANLELPVCEWITSKKVDDIDLLLQRLLWPSPIVRERAAKGLAILIKDKENRGSALKRLLDWLKVQKLESVVALGLLPLLKASEEQGYKLDIELSQVIEALPLSSIVIEEELSELCRLTKTDLKLPRHWKEIEIYPPNYQPSAFFLRNVKGFLAPIYMDRAEEIEQRSGMQFIKQWAFTAQKLLEECSLKEEYGDSMYYMGRKNSPQLIGMSAKIGEVYRTAFLRVLQHYNNHGYIPDNFFKRFAFATLPVELSFWKVNYARAPEWWPKFSAAHPHSEEELDLSKVGLLENLQNTIEKHDQSMLLALDGAVCPAEGWLDGLVDSSVSMVCFGYQVTGKSFPKPEEVAEIFYWPKMVLGQDTKKPFNFLEAYTDQIPTVAEPYVQFEDLIIFPLALRATDSVIDLWHWYRDVHPSLDRKSTRLNSSHIPLSRMPSST